MSNRKHEDREEEPLSRRRQMIEHDEELNIETENTRNSHHVNPISQTTGLVNEETNTNPTTSAGISNQMTGTRTVDESTFQQQEEANNNNISEHNVEPVEGLIVNPANVNNIVENSSNEIIQRQNTHRQEEEQLHSHSNFHEQMEEQHRSQRDFHERVEEDHRRSQRFQEQMEEQRLRLQRNLRELSEEQRRSQRDFHERVEEEHSRYSRELSEEHRRYFRELMEEQRSSQRDFHERVEEDRRRSQRFQEQMEEQRLRLQRNLRELSEEQRRSQRDFRERVEEEHRRYSRELPEEHQRQRREQRERLQLREQRERLQRELQRRRPLPPTGLSDEKFNEFERIIYNAAQEEEDKLDVCPICLYPRKSDETILILPCTHRYHEFCAKGLFQTMTTCGLCRKDYNVNV